MDIKQIQEIFPDSEIVEETKTSNRESTVSQTNSRSVNPLLPFIETYLTQRKWSVFPIFFKKAILEEDGKIQKNVVFLGGWKPKQEFFISKDDALWDKANGIAIITGETSNLTVIDFDTLDNPEIDNLPETYTVKTNKGYHLYYKFNPKVVSNSGKIIKGVDFKSAGGLVFAPPSNYELPNGERANYELIKDLPIADFPIEWYEKHKKLANGFEDLFAPSAWKANISQETVKGSRNDTFASIIGGQIKSLAIDDFETVGWNVAQSLNQTHNKPPLTAQELRNIFDSITSREKKQRSTDSAIKDIKIELIDEGYLITVFLQDCQIKVKFRNIINATGEAHSLLWMEKTHGVTQELNFRIKLNSDTNKEQWARQLSKAFDKKANNELYPWTILVSEITSLLMKELANIKQGFSLSEIESIPFTWTLEPFIQQGAINLLFGMGSSGKTLLANFFSILIGTKQPFQKTPTTYCPILFIDYENTASTWRDGIYNLLNTENIDLIELEKSFFYWDSGQIPLYEQTDKLRLFIKQNNIGLLIVDSASMASGDSTSDEESAIRLMATLKALKTTALIIAHQRKNDGERTPIGSIQYENQARNVWNVSSERDVADDKILHIACKHTKANNTFLRKNPIGFKVSFVEGAVKIENENAAENFVKKFTIVSQIQFNLESGPKTTKELGELIDSSLNNINKELSRLKAKGLIDITNEKPGVLGGKWYPIPKEEV